MSGKYDVIVIGAGAVGCAVARELSRYSIRTLVLEINVSKIELNGIEKD